MKIWTITTDSDSGVTCEVVHTEADMNRRASEIVASYWLPLMDGFAFASWQDAYAYMQGQLWEHGDLYLMQVQEHDLSAHPDLADAPAFGMSPNLQDHLETVTAAYIKAAQNQADDDLEIDDLAYVSISDDGDGAFVAAWLWVQEADAAKHMPPLLPETL